jgi:hypothetical protein
MYTSGDFSSEISTWKCGGGPLSHKQGGLIHQFNVLLDRDLKIRVLLLL